MYNNDPIQFLLILLSVLVVLLLLVVILIFILLSNSRNNDTAAKKQKIKGEIPVVRAATYEGRDDLIMQIDKKNERENLLEKRETNDLFAQVDNQLVTTSVPGPKITINSMTKYEPKLLEKPIVFANESPNHRGDEQRYLIMRNSAFEKMKDALNWGKQTKVNKVEQGGVLLGRASRYKNEIYCFVEDILLADTSGNPVFVEFTNEMWADMQKDLSEKNAQPNRSGQLVIVGWFHTHPNNLSVFMSGTDMTTQRLNFSEEWQASLVLNPHSNKGRVFFGRKATVGKIKFSDTL